MSQVPLSSQFSTKRPVGQAMQRALILEHFTDGFVETRLGSCWMDGDDGWLLEADERREFTARAEEIIDWRFVMERRGRVYMIVAAPIAYLLLQWILGSLAGMSAEWARGIAIGAVLMIAMACSMPVMIMDWRLKALRQRMRRRMQGREALPAEFVGARKLGNPWVAMAQVLAVLTVIGTMGYGLFGQSELAMRIPLPASLTIPVMNETTMMQWSGGAVVMVWLLFGFSRIRRWRNGRKEARFQADRALAALPLPGDRDVERDLLNPDRDLAAFDRLLAGTAPPPTA